MKLSNNTDSGASTHMNCDNAGMFDCREIDEEIIVGSGRLVRSRKIGKLKVKVKQGNGKTTTIVLTNVKHVPGLWCNLFSLTSAIDKGFQLGNKERVITLLKGNEIIGFDQIYKTQSGFIMGVDFEPLFLVTSSMMLDEGKTIDINLFHKYIGHAGEKVTRNTASSMGINLSGKFQKCENCAISKAQQANLNKDIIPRATKKGYRLMYDISSIKT